jgi:hypothetical protein
MPLSAEDRLAQRQWVLYWVDLAQVLHRASEELWRAYDDAMSQYKAAAAARNEPLIVDMEDPNPRLFSVSYLLLGAAMENLLKATLLLSEWPDNVEVLGHNLPALAQAAHLPINQHHRQLLGRLREAIEWRSKYPVPRLGRPPPTQGELSPDDRPALLEIHGLCRAAYGAAYKRALEASEGQDFRTD